MIVLDASVLIARFDASDAHRDRADTLLLRVADEPLAAPPSASDYRERLLVVDLARRSWVIDVVAAGASLGHRRERRVRPGGVRVDRGIP